MEDYIVPVFVEAKMEYTNQLVNVLKSHIYEGLKSIYEESCQICQTKGNKHLRLKTYQTLLSQIPQWNQEIIETEYSRIMVASGCDWFDDLVTAVFLAHTKILTSIGQRKGIESVNLNIPRSSNFVHKIYINVAREIWKNPYLFEHEISAHNYQKNIRDTERIIMEGIKDTIRRSLPVKDILRDYLTLREEGDGENDEADEEEEEEAKTKYNINKEEPDESENESDNEENIKLPEPDSEPEPDPEPEPEPNEIKQIDINENTDSFNDSTIIPTETDASMASTESGLPQAIANAPSEGQSDTSLDTSGSIPTVDTTIGGESHSELTDGDPTFQQSISSSEPAPETDDKNISLTHTGGDVNMSFDDGDSMDNFMSDAAKLVEKNNPEERDNIQKYLESKTQEKETGEKVFTLFDDAADTDDL
jgi:hypothetical protein